MSLINRALNRFASWAVARGQNVNPDPSSSTEKPAIWGYVIADYVDGGPYLTRVLFPRVFGWRLMLHKFHRPDGDRALHNHPWRSAFSVVIRGSYTEQRMLEPEDVNGSDAPEVVTRLVRWFNRLTDRDYHRIAELHGEEVWTLFFIGERIQSWGFLDENGFTPWRKYIDARRAAHAAAKEKRSALDAALQMLLVAADEELDEVGHMHKVPRKRTYKLEGKLSVLDTIEADADYRERIARAIHLDYSRE